MTLDEIHTLFEQFLSTSWNLGDQKPFLRAYLRLLLLHEGELLPRELLVLRERQKEFRGESFDVAAKHKGREESATAMNAGLRAEPPTRRTAIGHLLFCCLSDLEENDLFYLTEPMFDFLRAMRVSPEDAVLILQDEFDGFAPYLATGGPGTG